MPDRRLPQRKWLRLASSNASERWQGQDRLPPAAGLRETKHTDGDDPAMQLAHPHSPLLSSALNTVHGPWDRSTATIPPG
eukprot:scaffold16299_cov288-Ochromonas_danica.AAC.1